jgi:hypothetical protein
MLVRVSERTVAEGYWPQLAVPTGPVVLQRPALRTAFACSATGAVFFVSTENK